MAVKWRFDLKGPHTSNLEGPMPLVPEDLDLPPKCGLYLVACGDCLAHVGTSMNIRRRVRQLATLGFHRGASEVLCAAYCTGQKPLVWWEQHQSIKRARQRESEFKDYYDEPPSPHSKYRKSCKNGQKLKDELVIVAGRDSWEAGFIETVFAIGNMLNMLFDENKFHEKFPKHKYKRIEEIWKQVGKPPGPWQKHY